MSCSRVLSVRSLAHGVCRGGTGRGMAQKAPCIRMMATSSGLRIRFGAACKPHPSKLAKGGEDAYFGCRGSEGSEGFSCFGVSDGVGGSATASIDPGVFSREMLRRCHLALTAEGGLPTTVLDTGLGRWMKLALQEAGAGLAAAVPRIEGSATLLLGGLDP